MAGKASRATGRQADRRGMLRIYVRLYVMLSTKGFRLRVVLCLCVHVHVPFERQSWEMVCSDNFLSYKTQMSKSTVKLWIFFLCLI